MFTPPHDAPAHFQLSADSAIDVPPDAANSALQMALGDAADWQAEWLPSGRRVLLHVTAGAVRVLDDATAYARGEAASLFDAWLAVTDAHPASNLVLGDVLMLDGEDLRAQALNVRRRLLEQHVRGLGLALAGHGTPALADIVRAPSWRTLGIAYTRAREYGAAGLVFRWRGGQYGAKPLVRWARPVFGSN